MSTGETTQTISLNKEGEYNIILKNKIGFTCSRKYIVAKSYLAKIKNIIVPDLQQTNQETVELDNASDYEYKLQHENGSETSCQISNLFKNAHGGFHQLILKNKNGYGQISNSFNVLNAPKFFTPNVDGCHDY